MKKFFALIIAAIICAGCGEVKEVQADVMPPPDPIELQLHSMTLEEKIVQMVMVGFYGTELNDDMILWLLEHDEFREIEMCRDYYAPDGTSSGAKTADGGRGNITVTTTVSKSSSRRYVCPCCGMIIRATKQVNVICGDCMTKLIET